MILSIESSCDDSSIAITQIQDAKLLYHKKISQERQHSVYGGVVPELASRLHTQFLPSVLQDSKEFLGDFSKLKAICVTTQPGLSVSLIEGLMMAKTLSLSLGIPLIDINHLIGHFYSLFINDTKVIFPMSVLLVSGGHTQILEARNHTSFRIIAQSIDDSFGESFDKVAKMLHLGYPGGPIIEQYTKDYTKDLLSLPIPLKHKKTLEFSFSGLKNATRIAIQKEIQNLGLQEDYKESTQMPQESIAKICASFQASAIEHICDKLHRYFQASTIQSFAIVGGASANLALRARIQNLCEQYNKKLFVPSLEFCSDNAAMIGRAGLEDFKMGYCSDIMSVDISPKNISDRFV